MLDMSNFINAYNITNRFQQDPNKVLYQISETTILPEPENLSDTESDTSEEDIHQFHILLLPVYNILNNPVPALPIVNNMAQPNQQDFQQLRAAITTLAQALPNTNNDLARNTQTINNPPHREGRVAELPYFYEGNQDPVVWLEDFTRACNANGIANGRKLKVVLAYLRGAASTWWNANQALPNNNQNRITAWTSAVSTYLNKFTLMTTNNHTADLLKAIQDLTKQTSGQTLQSSNRPNQYICYASGKPRHVVRTCLNKNNNFSHSNNSQNANNNSAAPQPTSSNDQLAQIHQLLAQLAQMYTPDDNFLKSDTIRSIPRYKDYTKQG
ncbi:hypothetical protein RclHR1_15790001 [Rhizophagus clarus]|uniref:Retrotransposon gag domain-containing protein n=1 Tax=Rhizophagus clarus TaxID=94130 RepID=A0A2Z6QTJ4_9GLOM|nr:hypothetical protein RclHR1_15790001 [Rhizophagus clarus]